MIRRPPRSPLFPSTTLFRSTATQQHAGGAIQPRELIDVQLASNRRDSGDPAADSGAYRGAAEAVERTAEQREPERSEEHTSELQSQSNLVCRLLLEKKKKKH